MKLVNASTSKNTEYSNTFAAKTFQTYLHSRKIEKEIRELSKEEFCQILPKFYASVKAANGEYYSASTMLTLRSSLNRCIAATRMPTFCIITDQSFSSANRVFKAVLKKLREVGKGKITHKSAINEADLQRLYSSPNVFNINTPHTLLNKVFFEVAFFFCRRGMENLCHLRKTDFQVRENESEMKYVVKVVSESDKNHTGMNIERYETEGGRMYAVSNSDRCPVNSFAKYISKLNPSCSRLFQMPRANYNTNDAVWYQNKPIGKNILSTKLSQISKEAGLSKVYTNHCIRATSITTLSHSGFEARHIRTISGHKNDASLDSYVRETSTGMKRAMSEALFNAIGGPVEKQPRFDRLPAGCSSETRETFNADVAEVTFDLAPTFENEHDKSGNTHIVNSSTLNAVSSSNSYRIPCLNVTANTVVIHNHYH